MTKGLAGSTLANCMRPFPLFIAVLLQAATLVAGEGAQFEAAQPGDVAAIERKMKEGDVVKVERFNVAFDSGLGDQFNAVFFEGTRGAVRTESFAAAVTKLQKESLEGASTVFLRKTIFGWQFLGIKASRDEAGKMIYR